MKKKLTVKKLSDLRVQPIEAPSLGPFDWSALRKHVEKKCECGADKVYGKNCGTHSDWCPKYEV